MEVEEIESLFERLALPCKEEAVKPRATFLKVGAISTVRGSAYMEYGSTKVLAVIEPPREPINQLRRVEGELGTVNCTMKFAPFASRKDTEITDRRENFYSVALKKALEPLICRNEFPNLQLDIKVTVLDDDGCVLSTAINCCGAALVDGGIALYDLISASTACAYKEHIVLSPDAVLEESLLSNNEKLEDVEHGVVVTSSLAVMDQITECYQRGYLSQETYRSLIKQTVMLNRRMLEIIQQVVMTKVKEHFRINNNDNDTNAEDQAL